MTGHITYTPTSKADHSRFGCEGKPSVENLAQGTIWTCDECGKEWVLVYGAQYNQSYSAWRKLTERNRDGVDRQ